MNFCENCKWFGFEEVKMSKRVYSALIDDMTTIQYVSDERVCNRTQPTTLLEKRKIGCSEYISAEDVDIK